MKLAFFSVTLYAVMLLGCYELSAQEVGNETCVVPVVVADYDNKVVPDLQKADVSVRLSGAPVHVSDVRIDGSPRRIVLILDASANIPEEEWTFEVKAANSLTQYARPTDRFALFVIGDESAEHSFLRSDETTLRISKLKRSKAPEKTYDALRSAIKLLVPAQFGDTILLIGHDGDSGSAATFGEIRELMLNRNVRFFGISFADKFAKLPPGFDLNKPLPSGFGYSKLESLSSDSGYFFSFHTVRSLRMPGQEALFKGFLGDLYGWIAQPYRLSFASANARGRPTMQLDVAQMDIRKIHRSGIHYPHFPPCGSAAAVP